MAGIDTVSRGNTDAPQTTSRAAFQTEPGRPHPLGAIVDKEGVNFSVFSRNATAVELLLFARQDDVKPIQIVKLDPPDHQTFFFWHVYVRGIKAGAHYAYRVGSSAERRRVQISSLVRLRSNWNAAVRNPYLLATSAFGATCSLCLFNTISSNEGYGSIRRLMEWR
jgi:pullulanase/glycogen debranching enzyme